MKVKSESKVAQLCPTPSNPMDCSLPGSSVHGIFQARVLEWGAIAFSIESPIPFLIFSHSPHDLKIQFIIYLILYFYLSFHQGRHLYLFLPECAEQCLYIVGTGGISSYD